MEFRLFGDVTAVVNGDEFTLGNGRPAAVLSLLLLQPGRVMTLDRLVDELWGEEPPAKAEHAVRVYVSRLRAVLSEGGVEEPMVVAGSGGYMADLPRSAVDVLRFEDLIGQAAHDEDPRRALAYLDDALDLWNEEPLAGFPYADFAVRARRELGESRLEASELWADAALDADRASDVVSYLTPLLEEHRFREKLWASLAIALYREQRQTDALRAIEGARSTLAEVGLEVGPRLKELETSILHHDPTLRPRRDPPHNLPTPVDSFVGRDQEILGIDATLKNSRLISLVGPGGCGKTRLALQTAWYLLDSRDEKIWLVDLAPVDAPEAVPATAVEALGLGPWSRKGPVEALTEVIGDREALIVLDNCEHVIEAAASFAEGMLRRCSNLRILTTTREPLRISGESVITIPSLPVPPVGAPVSDLDGFDATALFLDRTRNADPSFDLTGDNAPSVVEIVRMLDGIPLAIELAAVRVRTMSVTEIARHLDDLFGTLGVGSRTALPRHRTLEAALDWSMDLLDDDERAVFSQLGVLRSDFGLDAATAVAGGGDGAAFERILAGLVEKSMVVSIVDSEPRYRLLEPVRQYAKGRLDETGQTPRVQERRDRYFSALAQEAGEGVRRFEDPHWRRRFGRERPNLLTSVDSLLRRGEPDRAAAITVTIARYLLELGLYDEGKRLIRSVLRNTLPPSASNRLALLVGGAFLGVHQGDYDATEEFALEAISLADREGSPAMKASALNALGSLAAERGNMRVAAGRLKEARRVSGAENLSVYVPATINLAAVGAWAGQIRQSERLIDEINSFPDSSSLSHFGTALRGLTARMRGDLATAGELLTKAIELFDERGSTFHATLFRVERAVVAFEDEDPELSQHLLGDVLNNADTGVAPLAARMRAEILAARLQVTADAPDADQSDLLSTIEEALATGTVGIVAEAADVAGEMALAANDRTTAALLIHGASALRDEIELARDPWEQRSHEKALSQVHELDVESPTNTDPIALAGLIREAIRAEAPRP